MTSRCPVCGSTFTGSERLCPHDGSVLESEETRETRPITTVLEGKYRLDAFLSQGGMGAVYRGTHLMLDRAVAVKLIKPELVTSPDMVRRFQQEARAVTRLNHPNIVHVYDLGQTQDGTLYIAMELVSGESLKQLIHTSGALAPDRILRIFKQIVSGLGAAHRQNVIHRDLKPQNIMISRDADGHEVAKLLDFGIAKTFQGETQLTATGVTLGTPQYMAPEQAAGQQVDARSDLYSLGIILYEMLVGDVPFNDPSTPAVLVKHLTERPEPPTRRRPDISISPELEAIALHCLEKDPAKRFQNAGELLQALEDIRPTTPTGIPVQPATVISEIGSQQQRAAGDAHAAVPTAAMPAAAAIAALATPPPIPKTEGGTSLPPKQPPAVSSPPASVAFAESPVTSAALVPSPAPVTAVAPIGAPNVPVLRQPRRRSVLLPVAVIVLSVLAVGVYWATSKMRSDSVAQSVGGAVPTAIANAAPGLTGASANTQSSVPATTGDSKQPPPATPPGNDQATPPPAAAPPPSGIAPAAPPSGSTDRAAAAASSSAPPSDVRSAGAAVASTGAGTTSRAASNRAAAATTAPAIKTAPQPAAPPIPAKPSISFRCAGPGEVCGALTSAIQESAEREGITVTRSSAGADVALGAEVSIIDQRAQSQFGTTFVIRTYSIDFSGDAARFDGVISMPAPKTFSADVRIGRERIEENARVAAADAIARVTEFWKKLK